MSKNILREKAENVEEEQTSKPAVEEKPIQRKDSSIKSVLDGSILTRSFIRKSIPMFILLFFLGMAFIANRYVIEKTSLEINEKKKNLDVLQMRYTQINGEYMRVQRITEISKRLDSIGVRESTSQPRKIIVKSIEE